MSATQETAPATWCVIHGHGCTCPLAVDPSSLRYITAPSPENVAAHAAYEAHVAESRAWFERQMVADTIASAVGAEPDPAGWLAGVIAEAATTTCSDVLFRCASAIAEIAGKPVAA